MADLRIISVMLLALWACSAVWAAGIARSGPECGQLAPELNGHQMHGESYHLKRDTGKPKLLNFFWIECLPCKKELPELAELEVLYPEVKFMAIHTRDEPDWVVAQFIRGLKAAPRSIIIPDRSMRDPYNYAGLPHTVLLDEENRVVANLTGYTPQNSRRLVELLELIKMQKSRND